MCAISETNNTNQCNSLNNKKLLVKLIFQTNSRSYKAQFSTLHCGIIHLSHDIKMTQKSIKGIRSMQMITVASQ